MLKKIGLLFSLSGTTSIVEKGQHQAAQLEIEDINSKNPDVKFLSLTEDIRSDPNVAAKKAYKLLTKDKVDVLVGCYTSACRKAVLPVLERTGGTLFYPTLYEGMECHPNVFYCGTTPNQQVEWMLSWAIQNLGKRFVLIGSDYIYPRSTNEQVKKWIERAGGKIVLEKYLPLGCVEFAKLLEEIRKTSNLHTPFIIFSTLVGSSVSAFYRQYRSMGFSFPIISPITGEREIEAMGIDAAKGHYCVSSYFQTIDNEKNNNFIKNYQLSFGNEPICGVMEAAYIAISLIAKAYNIIAVSSSKNKKNFYETVGEITLDAPQGNVMMDKQTQHLWLWSRIGLVNENGIIEIVWTSPGPIPPRPFIENAETDNQKKSTEIDKIKTFDFINIIGKEENFVEKIEMSKVAAATSANVLITGESGTGKELFAKAIHEESVRRQFPFIAINCAAIPRDLIVSELFGYEEGSFTGAQKGGKKGKFEMADKGTLFLDEIGEMPLDLQVHLLRVLQEKEIYRIGGGKPIPVDVRIIAATNRDLLEEIAWSDAFRSDLYYRLNVFHIALPPLRQRKNDIPLLIEYFLRQLNVKNSTKKSFSKETLKILQTYTWPGNIREVANVVERSFYVAAKLPVILAEHLPETIINSLATLDEAYIAGSKGLFNRQFEEKKDSIKDNEKQIIQTVIINSGGNLSLAAKKLGITRSTLYRKINLYNLKRA